MMQRIQRAVLRGQELLKGALKIGYFSLFQHPNPGSETVDEIPIVRDKEQIALMQGAHCPDRLSAPDYSLRPPGAQPGGHDALRPGLYRPDSPELLDRQHLISTELPLSKSDRHFSVLLGLVSLADALDALLHRLSSLDRPPGAQPGGHDALRPGLYRPDSPEPAVPE